MDPPSSSFLPIFLSIFSELTLPFPPFRDEFNVAPGAGFPDVRTESIVRGVSKGGRRRC